MQKQLMHHLGGNTSPQYSLNVFKQGTGSGAVISSNLPGINCGTTCSSSYSSGTVVYLTANPTSDSEFIGWSGEECPRTSLCSVIMSQARNVTAIFNISQTFIESGPLYSTGNNQLGRTGLGFSSGTTSSPTQVGSFTDWQNISASRIYSLGIRNGRLYSWGSNLNGRTGLGTTNGSETTPTQVGSFTDWQFVGTGYNHALGIRNGRLYSWGSNNHSATGHNVYTGNTLVPTQVGSLTGWTHVSGGAAHSLGIRNGRLYSWGNNEYGQLGLGDNNFRGVPTQVGSLADWTYVDSFSDFLGHHSLGIRNGLLYAWGRNNYGQLGDGTFIDRNTPVQIGSLTGWTHVSAGEYHSLGIRNGELYVWGRNNSGQLGLADFNDRTSPTRLGSSFSWIDVSAGSEHSLGVRAEPDPRLLAWGGNTYGQLGYGNYLSQNQPIIVGSLTGWTYVSAGREHSLIIR